MSILKIIWRLIVVTLAFFIATAGAALLLAVSIGQHILALASSGNSVDLVHFALAAAKLCLELAMVGFAPWLIAMLVAEVLAQRSIYYYVGAGALCGALADHGGQRASVLAIATGLLAGLIYWLIAGRSAGNWWVQRARPADPPAPHGDAA